MSFYSPLRYPGGKSKLAPFVKQVIVENNLHDFNYVEPYAGGAGVALTLLFEEYVPNITINDYDKSIYAFWKSITSKTDDFCQKIIETPITIDSWFEQKKIQENAKQSNLFELGFSTFFLNRTNISGVLKGGVIGGIKQRGNYKIDARFKKDLLITRIQKIGKYKKNIKVTNKDAKIILEDSNNNCLMYIDPPYVEKGKDLYLNYYLEKDHKDISTALLKDKSNYYWILSYDKNDLIRSLYGQCKNFATWKLHYGASNTNGCEDIFLHPKLKFKEALNLLHTPSCKS